MRAFAIALIVCLAATGCADAAAANLVSAKLVADREQIAPGDAFRIGIRFDIPPKAHIYWANPGDSGLATQVTWSLSDGINAGSVLWPIPASFHDDFLDETSFGYAEETLLFAIAQAPPQLRSGDTVAVRAEVAWLVCLDDGTCVPESASLELRVPVASSAKRSANASMFDMYAARVPRAVAGAGVPVTIRIVESPAPSIRIHLDAPWVIDANAEPAEMFPDRGGPWRLMSGSVDDVDGHVIAFASPQGFDGSPAGAVSLHVRNSNTGERRAVYLRIGNTRSGT